MERILLPLPEGTESSDATVLEWHVTAGMPLTRHFSLATVQIDTHTLQYSLLCEGRGFVVKQLSVLVGERVGSDRTLALVGLPDEPLPNGLASETIPPFGTSAFMRRRLFYLRILRTTLACAILLLGLDIWIGAFVTVAGSAAPGILLVLQRALDTYYPTALGCLFAPIVLLVGALLLFLMPPGPKHVLKTQHLSIRPDA